MKAHVVCGIDGTPAAFAAAMLAHEIARQLELPLETLHASCVRPAAEQLARARALQDGLERGLGPDALLRVEIGHPERRLIEASRRARLLVIATRRRGAVRWALSGSVTSAVTRFAAAPVLVVPRRALSDGIARLGAGAVVSAVRDERDLASAATAACWARELGRALLLAHVVPPRRLPATAVGMPPPAVLATTAGRLAGGRRMLEEIACAIAPVAPSACGTRVLVGAVGPHLVRLAAAEDAALLAVGRPRSVSPFMRSPTTHLLRRAACAVMVCPSPDAVFALASAAHRELPAAPRAPAPPGP
jgi:nucleotide-binding universal stress UspA family protein